MKKTALHFKLASWSIKNPKTTYVIIGGVVVLIFLVGALVVGATSPKNNATRGQGAISQVNQQSGANGPWREIDQSIKGNQKCIRYKREDNGTKITSCYTKSGDDWRFSQSY